MRYCMKEGAPEKPRYGPCEETHGAIGGYPTTAWSFTSDSAANITADTFNTGAAGIWRFSTSATGG